MLKDSPYFQKILEKKKKKLRKFKRLEQNIVEATSTTDESKKEFEQYKKFYDDY